VTETRAPGEAPSYSRRLERAVAAGAQMLLSIHFDVRGEAWQVDEQGGRACYESYGSVGFAVLWSDEGPLASRRHDLARALSTQLEERGFHPYDGEDYPGLYDPDPLTPGVFVDRHPERQRIFLLRASGLPALILETHHALHREEWARWQEEATRAALADAVEDALLRSQ